jgi:hypothetical protein
MKIDIEKAKEEFEKTSKEIIDNSNQYNNYLRIESIKNRFEEAQAEILETQIENMDDLYILKGDFIYKTYQSFLLKEEGDD